MSFTLELDDQFSPKKVKISNEKTCVTLEIGDGKNSDNHGGGGMLWMTDKKTDKQISMHLPKSAVSALKEVFRNGCY